MQNKYKNPRLKLFVEFHSDKNKIYFFKRPGVAIALDDVSGFILAVCKVMDGNKSFEQLYEMLLQSHPNEAPYLITLLTVLDEELLLEDVSKNQPKILSEYDVNRWSRNIEFFSAYNKAETNKYLNQEKIKMAKVTVLGLGGVGSHVLYNLAALGVHNFRIVDFDNVELSNLNRQILYNENDIGQPKTVAAKNRILEFLPHANIETFNTKISCSKDIEKIIDGQDIVISAADQPRNKIIDWLNVACVKKKITFICGALDSKWAIYYTVIPGKTGCIECWKTSAKSNGYIFQDFMNQVGFNAAQAPNVTIMPFISIVSGLIVTELLKILTGIAEPQSLNRLCAFDFNSADISIIESWEKKAKCNVCFSLKENLTGINE